MRSENLTTEQVLDVFTNELAARGGRVTENFNDGKRLFARSVLPLSEDVRPGDRIQGGLALKATDEQICVYPYTIRLVCRNGAIRAETVGALCIEGLHQADPYITLESIREAIEACSAPEVFRDTVNKMRQTAETQIDTFLNLLPVLSHLPESIRNDVMRQFLKQFFKEKDQTQFGLANAITAVARETRDPELRWNLEELGGGLLVAVLPKLPQDSARAVRVKRAAGPRRRLVTVA